jgi:mRNA interferase MazF
MTTGSRPAPFRIPITHGGKTGLILLDQIRTVDKVRLSKRSGNLDSAVLNTTLRTLQDIFAI